MCLRLVRRQINYKFFFNTNWCTSKEYLYGYDFLCEFSTNLPSWLYLPLSLCLHSCNGTSCIFPPCFLCIQSCVFLIRPAMFSPRFVWQQLC